MKKKIARLIICMFLAVVTVIPTAFIPSVTANAAQGWIHDSVGWWYQNSNGSWTRNNWQLINGKWYFFNNSGYMVTGWKYVGNKWYYMDSSGAMQTGWVWVGNKWYYLNGSGAMQTGWLKDGSTWYYLNGSGAMQTGWVWVGNKWYYLNGNGAMQTGWVWVGNKWYYLNGSGAMQTGWLKDGNTWYYLNGSGAMQTSKWIGDYYVQSDGSMAVDTWIDGYYVDETGKWDGKPQKQEPQTIPLVSISLNKTVLEMETGNSVQLDVTYNPSNTTEDKTVKWNSNNTTVCTVENGKITAKSAGTATITATSVNGKTATCKVTVKDKEIPLESITISSSTIDLKIGESKELTVIFNPSNTTEDKTIKWSSNNTSVCTVENGKITAKSAGTAMITATAKNGKMASCKVTVSKEETEVEQLIMNNTTDTLFPGETGTCSLYWLPENATNVEITWKSSDENVLTVEGYSGTASVKALKPGKATVTATSENGKTASCVFTVNTPVESISLNYTELQMDGGDSAKLTYTLNPSGAIQKDPYVSITSSNDDVVTIGAGNVIKAVSGGNAVITVKIDGKTATCNVTVKDKIEYYNDITKAKALFDLVNDYREENGLWRLEWQGDSDDYAYQASKARATYNILTESTPDGWANHGGDQIGLGGGGLSTPEELFNIWKNSPMHNSNMLASDQYVRTGSIAIMVKEVNGIIKASSTIMTFDVTDERRAEFSQEDIEKDFKLVSGIAYDEKDQYLIYSDRY